jgi:hypothetical protein
MCKHSSINRGAGTLPFSPDWKSWAKKGTLNLPVKRTDVLAAADDLRRRTLAHLPLALERMIYLASTRDYNNGLYYHQGLASKYSEVAACEGLADCHRESFDDLFAASLEELVRQLQAYAETTGATAANFVAAWQELEPYRVAVPIGTDSLAADFVFSNLKLALAIFEARLDQHMSAPLA